MLISLSVFGRGIFSFEIGRRFITVDGPDGPSVIHLGSAIEVADDEEDAAPGELLPYGFSQQ